MQQFKLYNSKEIEKLKEDLDVYKQTYNPNMPNDLTEYHLQLKRELYDLKRNLSQVKGVVKTMEEKYRQLEKYEHQDQKILYSMETINDSLYKLKKDMETIRSGVEDLQITEALDKMNVIINRTDENLITVKEQLQKQKAELLETKESPKQNYAQASTSHPSEYKQLQKILNTLSKQQQPHSLGVNRPLKNSSNTIPNRPFTEQRRPITRRKESSPLNNYHNPYNKNIITRTYSSRKAMTGSALEPNKEETEIISFKPTKVNEKDTLIKEQKQEELEMKKPSTEVVVEEHALKEENVIEEKEKVEEVKSNKSEDLSIKNVETTITSEHESQENKPNSFLSFIKKTFS
ncbi:hypothetical protein [Halalkalibacillus halophilus]|uniref:hypothetical protein n=1 Tax=Halalkalibacillus halophilus TaxID=392827 RepID=UPI000404EF3C|nr:hypothetical protein [Halalkalibacillus halophilus]